MGTVADTTLRFVAAGVPHVLRTWPGLVVVLAAYVAVSVPLAVAGVGYPQLLGIVAATLAAASWYGSPLGRREARRRIDP
ncbi:MAG: hypothetical protein ACYDEN_07565 [Acidimicrobiales bacterium]